MNIKYSKQAVKQFSNFFRAQVILERHSFNTELN
jgi:hypothetical protein